jgi:hypothetical protein
MELTNQAVKVLSVFGALFLLGIILRFLKLKEDFANSKNTLNNVQKLMGN